MTNISHRVHSKKNNLFAKVSLKTGLNLNKPTYICAKMTMRCNSRCIHCNIWNMDFDEQELTTDEWFRILNELQDWLGKFNMVFTGGEALVRDDMIDILNYAVKKDIRVELLSNSIMVDDLLAERIIDTGIAQFTTSFDGIKAETHDRVRGKAGFYNKTVAAISALCAYRKKQEKPIYILLKTVISANNLQELTDIALFSQEMGVEVLYQPIEQNYGEAPNVDWYKKSALWICDIVILKEVIFQLQELKRQGYPIANSMDDLSMFIRYFEHPEKLMPAVQAHETRSPADSCRAAVTNFVISSNGDVRMCFKMDPIGNLRTSSPREIWKRRTRCWASKCSLR
jgi:MoaA/NifB/PqqE/SkfB family radical SAM enzyme